MHGTLASLKNDIVPLSAICATANRLESSHSLEKSAATFDMHGKGAQILLHCHSRAIAEFLRISLQQFYAVLVEPLGTFDDAAQISCVGQSI